MKGTSYSQLATFLVIAKEGSISGAAARLNIAPASVSQGLKALEKQLGLPLFTRTTRSIELTEAGRLLYERTQHPLNELSLAIESVSDLSRAPEGKVRITLPRFVYQFLLQPVYVEFCRRYPRIELEVSISDEAVNLMSEGFDMGIRFGDRVEEGMVARRLTPNMREALFVSPEYAAANGIPQSPQALSGHKLIQYRFIASRQLAPLLLNDKGNNLQVDMPLALIANDTDLMLDAALHGLGIGRIVEPMVREHFTSGALVPVLRDYWYPYEGLFVYFHQHAQKAKRVRVLVDFLLEKAFSYVKCE